MTKHRVAVLSVIAVASIGLLTRPVSAEGAGVCTEGAENVVVECPAPATTIVPPVCEGAVCEGAQPVSQPGTPYDDGPIWFNIGDPVFPTEGATESTVELDPSPWQQVELAPPW